jgi:hypothetical protein
MTQGMNGIHSKQEGMELPVENHRLVAEDPSTQECAEFQNLIPTRVRDGEDLQSYPHMQSCERCRALLSELEYIAEIARKLLPPVPEPRDELWAKIEMAIQREGA